LLRVAMVAGLFLSTAHPGNVYVSFPFDGDGRSMKQRSAWLRNVWAGVPVPTAYAAVAFEREYASTSYLLVLAYLQLWIGVSPFGVHLFNIVLYTAGCVLLSRTFRRTYGPTVAFGGLVVSLLMPSLIFWSVSVMKESFQFFVTAVAL